MRVKRVKQPIIGGFSKSGQVFEKKVAQYLIKVVIMGLEGSQKA